MAVLVAASEDSVCVGVGDVDSVASAVGALVASDDVTICVEEAVLLTWLRATMPPAPPAVSAAATMPSAFAFASAVDVR